MTREEHLRCSKFCTNQQFDNAQGITCKLTQRIADFEGDCPHFDKTPEGLRTDQRATIDSFIKKNSTFNRHYEKIDDINRPEYHLSHLPELITFRESYIVKVAMCFILTLFIVGVIYSPEKDLFSYSIVIFSTWFVAKILFETLIQKKRIFIISREGFKLWRDKEISWTAIEFILIGIYPKMNYRLVLVGSNGTTLKEIDISNLSYNKDHIAHICKLYRREFKKAKDNKTG